MLVLALLLVACTGVRARNFNVTYLDVPHIVPAGQQEVVVECRYDANFTLLSWFKGSNEFFRYRPGAAPSTRSFPILGVGTVEMLTCGPVVCQLRLGALTQEATGMYRCDIERDEPPYKFATMIAHMEVYGHEYRKPLLDGLAEDYKDGDMIQAYCRGAPDSELRWYINGVEMVEFRGLATLKKESNRLLFMGVPPTTVVQCAEFKYGRVYGSQQQKAKWNNGNQLRKKKENDVKNGTIVVTGRLVSLGICLCLFHKIFYI